MSNKNMKHKLNVPGSWYCTDPNDVNGEGCIACKSCYTSAPDFFTHDDEGSAYVIKQPTTAEQIALCQDQLEACPVKSIGKNG